MSNTVHCPKCNSESVIVGKKGFRGKKAVAGAILTGGIGLLAGTIGSNKVVITWLKCGYQWKPGQSEVPGKRKFQPTEKSRRLNKIVLITFAIIIVLIILACWL